MSADCVVVAVADDWVLIANPLLRNGVAKPTVSRVAGAKDGDCIVIWWLEDGVASRRREICGVETCRVPGDVVATEPSRGVTRDPSNDNRFGGRDASLDGDGLDDATPVPFGDVVDEPGDATDRPGELEDWLGVASVAEFVADASEPDDAPSSAAADPGLWAIAAPSASATANAPILPMNRAVDGVVAIGTVLS